MKYLFTSIILTLCQFFYSQNTNFIYEYTSIPDSTAKQNTLKELMVLTISKDKSEFYSLNQFKNDSIVKLDISKGFPPPPQSILQKSSRVIKENSRKNQITSIIPISSTTFVINEVLNLKWKLLEDSKKIMNFNVQKAVANYGGRTWIAWFTKEIPIQDGPYKFCQLPGLILEVEDTQRNHIFELKAIQNSPNNFSYPDNKYISYIKLDYPKFEKIYRKYRKEPIADIMDKIHDVKDENGYIVIPKSKLIKEIEESTVQELQKDNNIIEINLLK